MKRYVVKFVHQLIVLFRLDEIFVRLSGWSLFFVRFIPLHDNYKNPTIRLVKRNNVWFKLNISDYMQWHVWAGINDLSWKMAIKYSKGSIIDIGANVGSFSLKVLVNTKNTKVYAFEPNTAIFQNLNQNALLNSQIVDRLKTESFALSNKAGVFGLALNSSSSGASRLLNYIENSNTLMVKTITLDSYISENNLNDIKFIKIDVEGHEPQVLEGAIKTITKHKPDLYLEVTPIWWSNMGYDVYSVLSNLCSSVEYKLFPILNEEQTHLKEASLQEICNLTQQFNLYLSIN